MSIEVTIRCDAYRCYHTLTTEDIDEVENTLRWNRWEDDPDAVDQHYCPECWEVIKKEKAEQDDEQ